MCDDISSDKQAVPFVSSYVATTKVPKESNITHTKNKVSQGSGERGQAFLASSLVGGAPV